MATDGRLFLSHIRSCPRLNNVNDEKGAFAARQAALDDESIFGVIVSHVADSRELLVCDDLGDEWADFIGVNDESQPKTLSFYHAKHGDLTLGASGLHVVVSQAIKNLGRMNASDEEIVAKLDSLTACIMLLHPTPYSRGTLRFVREKTRLELGRFFEHVKQALAQ